MDTTNPTLKEKLQERFKDLPKVVQDAITSADVEHHLQQLADSHKLHLDQWQLLENEVLLTLMGFQKPEDLKANIVKEVGVDDATAQTLSDDISQSVFEPIREELERQLEHPEAKDAVESDMEAARKQQITEEGGRDITVNSPAGPQPATPPSPPPSQSASRAPISQTYTAKSPSAQRPAIVGDPYREQVG